MIFWVVGALAGVGGQGAQAQAPARKVVVLDLAAPPMLKNLGRTLSRMAAGEAEAMGFEVLSSRDLIDASGRDGEAAARACDGEPACLAGALEALGVERVIAGSMTRSKTHYQVHMVHVDLPTQQVVARLDSDILIASRRLVQEVRAGLPELMAGEPQQMGLLVVSCDVDGALVEIDGKPVGLTPGLSAPVPPGKHAVRVSKVNYLPVERFVEVGSQGETLFEVQLFLIPGRTEDEGVAQADPGELGPAAPPFRLPLGSWISAGVGAAFTLGGGVFGLQALSLEQAAEDKESDGILNITRVQATQGQQAAFYANLCYAGAGLALGSALVFLALDAEAPPEPGVAQLRAPALWLSPAGDGAGLVLQGSF